MNSEDKLKNNFGTDAGFRAPEGFFDKKFSQIASELPPYPEVKEVPLTRWQRLKPYVYLAAMFAGIWCTLKMVTMMGDGALRQSAPISLDNPPQAVAQALSSPDVADVTMPASTITDADIDAFLDDALMDEEIDAEDAPEDSMTEPDLDAYDIDIDQLRAELAAESDDESYYD